MSDLIDDPREGLNEPEFSVTEISSAIKRVIESGFSHVRIRGEVGRVSMPRSGHIYLDLKDDRSVISAVVWKGVAGRLAMVASSVAAMVCASVGVVARRGHGLVVSGAAMGGRLVRAPGCLVVLVMRRIAMALVLFGLGGVRLE